jgi:membrane-associated PAP2 superfamily phosphatase
MLHLIRRLYCKLIIKQAWFWLLLSCLSLMFIYPRTGWDEAITNMYFDVDTFYLKHDKFLVIVMHGGLKGLVLAIFFTLVFLWFSSFMRVRLAVIRSQLLWAWIGMVLSTTVISVLKNLSIHSCPDKLLVYYGNMPSFSLAETFTQSAVAGHCWPSGHASAGISLLAIYFAFRDSHPDFSNIAFAVSLLLWFVMGWAQVMRGIHFFSHNLWTLWIVWLVLEIQLTIWPLTPRNTLQNHA